MFAGKRQKWYMRDCLTKLGYENGVEIRVDCIDVQRKPWTDLSKKSERGNTLQKVRSGAYDAILPSPSCSTFSIEPLGKLQGTATIEKLR